MKKFKFGLDALLQARRIKEDEALRNLAEAQKKLQLELEGKRSLQNQLEDSLSQRDFLGNISTPAAAFQCIQNFIMGTKQRIVRADQSVFRANRAVDKAMAIYLQARKMTRMIETLKERALEEFKAERKKHEQKQQDELSIMRKRLTSEEEGDLE